jgi:hypothetical protein
MGGATRSSFTVSIFGRRLAMPRQMQYSGAAVPIFAWTPDGRPVPELTSACAGEAVGDQAFVDGRAMQWDGTGWVASMWKDFALWRNEDVNASPYEQRELVFDVIDLDDEIDLDGVDRELVQDLRSAVSADDVERAIDARELRRASAP